jgi:hypothetical protein
LTGSFVIVYGNRVTFHGHEINQFGIIMKAILAIAGKTIRSAIRKKIAHLLLFFSALTVFVLPLTVKSDGTAKGLVQVSVTYTLGITGILLSLTAIWLAATLMSEDIEGYQIHMVVTKPVGRFQLMLGKWLGVVVLLGGVLLVSSGGIYGMCMYRLHRTGFSEMELKALDQEVLTGRHSFESVPIDMDAFAEDLLAERLSQGAVIPQGMTRGLILDSLKSQVSKSSETVRYGQLRPWLFKGLPTDTEKEFVSLRYRVYVEAARKKNQRQTQGQWMLRNPDAEAGRSPYLVRPAVILGGTFMELHIPTELISPEGELDIRYVNLDRMGKPVVFQSADGPRLMVGAVSFFNNFSRVTLLLFLQVMFMATLGCAAGACFSTPMAVFMSFSYIFVGLLIRYADLSMEGVPKPESKDLIMQISGTISTVVSYSTFTLNEYVQIGVLTDGRLVEATSLGIAVAAMLFARAIPIMLIGLLFFYKRELGLVVRK